MEQQKTLGELVKQYLLVCTCWQDHKMSLKYKMSVEKAIRDLREVRDEARKYENGARLSFKANGLLNDIVKAPMDIDAKIAP